MVNGFGIYSYTILIDTSIGYLPMEKLQKIYRLHHFFKDRRYPASLQTLQQQLECSRATVGRIIRDMRLYFDAPIDYDRNRNGYHYVQKNGTSFELPGLWFSPDELLALLTMQQLLGAAQPGLLDTQLAPLRLRIEKLLAAEHLGSGEIPKRVKILRMAGRNIAPERFQTLADALVQRKQLAIRYSSRTTGEDSQREIAPQRLIHYRDNWYLDAWCQLRGALRSFAVERLGDAHVLDKACIDIPEDQLDAHFTSSYGIFAGQPEHTAILRFTPQRARWVTGEQWHPEQQARILEDGRYELHIPYSDPRELIMDILKYGSDVEVVAPPGLRQRVAEELGRAWGQYMAG
ncbi:MAG: helix-turn-helix transcriptional regulator [Sulfuriferula sp.]